MREVIVSMARFRVSNKYDQLYLLIDFVGDGEREVENRPHGHIRFKSQRLAQISLDPPFDLLSGHDKVSPEVLKIFKQFLNENTTYIHFVWKMASGQTVYDAELAAVQDQMETFRLRFNADNPQSPIR